MPLSDPYGPEAPLLQPDDLEAALVYRDDHYLVFNKPGWMVCHPSKQGPWSSLVGAAREHFHLDRVHLVSRLDRETSGLVILALHRLAARQAQMAFEARQVRKTYLALLAGTITEPFTIEVPLGPDKKSPVHSQVGPRPHGGGQSARTVFEPVQATPTATLCRVLPETGRKHQIRAHALHSGHPVLGDKIYGPDPTLFLEFIENGWTDRLASALPLQRQALHCWQLEASGPHFFCHLRTPIPEDWAALLPDAPMEPAEPSRFSIRFERETPGLTNSSPEQ